MPIAELFNLSSLKELFLDSSSLHNDFLQNHVASFTSLKVLRVSSCGLTGTLPDRGWCDLKNLEELDLSDNELEGTLPLCLGNLSSIRILDISHNQFTGNIGSTPIPNLKSIEFLCLKYNHFQVSLKLFANHSSLKAFLVDNGNKFIDEAAFQSWTPKFQLEALSVSNFIMKNSNSNFLNFLYHQFELRYLHLSRGTFGGAFPNWLFENNTRLEIIYLVDNSFVGPFQLPSHPNPNMSVIDLSHNKLRGHIPSNISLIFPNLRSLNLSKNYFQGTLPASLGELKFLAFLDLSNNQFSGELEEHQFAKAWMRLLKLSNNNLTGRIPTIFHLSMLSFLQLDGNNFVGEIPDLSTLNGLEVLDMSHNSLSGNLPRWMGNMSNLVAVLLSDNQFKGPIPSEFCKPYYLQFLDLSENNLSGSIPSCFSELRNLQHFFLRRNKLRGPMTESFVNMTYLVTLDLGENNFSGTIPNWIGNLSNLGILILRGNQFQGDIPIHLCNLSQLHIFDLSSNSLSGSLPPCLSHFPFTMGFHLLQPPWGATASNYLEKWGHADLFLTSIYKGVVKFTSKWNSLNYTGYILDHIYAIDLSCNRFSGEIPSQFGDLSNLRALNLSNNSLSGLIPSSFSKLKQLESLDLSYNNLNGQIPSQLIEVNTLAVFSVAHNNLSGPLPDFKAQFGTFNDSCYEGNPLLCGSPLNNSCEETHFASLPTHPFKEESEDDGFMNMTFFWVTFLVTYIVVLFSLALVLYINSYWRHAWFYNIEVCFNTCYYFVVDKFQ
ncbi:receptor-like protein 15 [Tripterygium wilfordii]|uniref:receptor-like protein 15 n=1 Tax=Tripterygium wilfordii TaxID=458696 RepID=UPI0018F7E99C|nr:receptor-like protein 15 [Tripterygium wilfordii]XP_038698973.1 receptor-like protein 15 [Tripterygium wilfordii]XP_038698974.1 receptor-like protein 15 [Tripterygium wilfordii]